jgi:7-cyano-7-deazaguanine reductase
LEEKMDNLKVLGTTVRRPIEKHELERFPTPANVTQVTFNITEFTSMCPVTGQPDFGTLIITFAPDEWCLESKSLKLYLWRYRDIGSFCESLASDIAQDIFDTIDPVYVKVVNRQAVRGGIATDSVAEIGR